MVLIFRGARTPGLPTQPGFSETDSNFYFNRGHLFIFVRHNGADLD